MSEVEFVRFKTVLRDEQLFITKPRLRLFGLLHHHPEVSVKALVKLADKNDQSTAYRNLNLFEKLGIINRLRLGWNSKVELSDMFQYHHHHFTCNSCGQITSLPENLNLEKEIEKLATTNGFKQADHHLEIRGLCQKCKMA